VILLLTLSLGACKKEFLDITPNHYLTEDNFYKTQQDFLQAVNAVYGDMQNFILDAHMLEEGRSDNTTYDTHLDQGSLGGTRQLGMMDQFRQTSDASIIQSAWTQLYNGIKDCNVPLLYLKNTDIDIDPALAIRLSGELRFFRAYYHFIALQYWGDVPLLLTPVITADDAFSIKRNPKEEVYAAILQDASYADSVLPASYTGADVGRVTKGTADMLLAKVHLTRHEYADAETALRKIIGSGQYALLPNYADIFDPASKNNKESIFEVQFKEGAEGESSNFMYQFAPVGSHGTVIVGPGAGGGLNIPTLDMVAAYEPSDLRKAVSVDSIDRGGITVYYIKKYDHDTDPNFARTPDDWTVYRYADVLLMLAETLNEQAYSTGEPFDLLNQVRTRAGLGALGSGGVPGQESFRDTLAHERRVELAFENHRWFDLLRTGKAIEVMSAYGAREIAHPTLPPPDFLPFDGNSYNLNADKLLYPIPGNELNKDPNLTQNPGY